MDVCVLVISTAGCSRLVSQSDSGSGTAKVVFLTGSDKVIFSTGAKKLPLVNAKGSFLRFGKVSFLRLTKFPFDIQFQDLSWFYLQLYHVYHSKYFQRYSLYDQTYLEVFESIQHLFLEDLDLANN